MTIRLAGAMRVCAVCVCGLAIACGDETTTPPTALPNGEIARIVVEPAAAILATPSSTKQLRVLAFDKDGRQVAATPTWTSSKPGDIAVSADGTVSPADAGGSAQIVATVDGVSSQPVLVVHTPLVQGAKALVDAQIVGEPKEVDEEGAYSVTLQNVATPAVGDVLINTEGKIVAGRVDSVSANGEQFDVTISVIPATELFPNLDLQESFDLSTASFEIPTEIEAAYDVTFKDGVLDFVPKNATATRQQPLVQGTAALPPFGSCEFSYNTLSGPSATGMPVKLTAPPLFSFALNSKLDVVHTPENGLEKLSLSGQPTIKVEGGLKVVAAIDGKVSCKAELAVIRIPVGGPLALVIGGLVPVGVGVDLGGRITVATFGVGSKVEIKAGYKAGIECQPNCDFVGDLTAPTAAFTPIIDLPTIGDWRVDPALDTYGYVSASIGNPFLKKLRFEAFSMKLGPGLRGSFALKASQIADPVYASNYKLVSEFKAGVGGGVQGLLALFGLNVASLLEFVVTAQIAGSPTGTVKFDRETIAAGDTVGVTVELNPADAEFLGIFNVQDILIVHNDGSLDPPVVGTLPAFPGETQVTGQFTARTGSKADEYYAFATTYLAPSFLPLELGKASGKDGVLRITPEAVNTDPRQETQFTPIFPSDPFEVVWTTTDDKGAVTADGLYTAGDVPGDYLVEVRGLFMPMLVAAAMVKVEPLEIFGTYEGTAEDYDYGSCTVDSATMMCRKYPIRVVVNDLGMNSVGVEVCRSGDATQGWCTSFPDGYQWIYEGMLMDNAISGSGHYYNGTRVLPFTAARGGSGLVGEAHWDINCEGTEGSGCYHKFDVAKVP